ncbi:hypothetical protein DsansV1_C03g0026271 [Dioscorea sansibarensis]
MGLPKKNLMPRQIFNPRVNGMGEWNEIADHLLRLCRCVTGQSPSHERASLSSNFTLNFPFSATALKFSIFRERFSELLNILSPFITSENQPCSVWRTWHLLLMRALCIANNASSVTHSSQNHTRDARQRNCKTVSGGQAVMLYIGLYGIAFGTSAVRVLEARRRYSLCRCGACSLCYIHDCRHQKSGDHSKSLSVFWLGFQFGVFEAQ